MLFRSLRNNIQQSCSLYLPHQLTLWAWDKMFSSLKLMVKLLLPSTESMISLNVFAKDQLTGFFLFYSSHLNLPAVAAALLFLHQGSLGLLLLAVSQVSQVVQWEQNKSIVKFKLQN